jgi:ferredoxin-NADP reductase
VHRCGSAGFADDPFLGCRNGGHDDAAGVDADPGIITITVKPAPDGFVSRYLVRQAVPGMIVDLAGPDGDFVLPEPPPTRVLFMTAGSGITPVRAMLHGLLPGPAARSAAAYHGSPDVVLLHSAPTAEDVIFGEELRALAARFANLRLYERHTRTDGRLRPADLPDLCPDWAGRSTWVCGPAEVLEQAEEHWAGSPGLLHVERFRPVILAAGAGGSTAPRVTGGSTRVAARRCWSPGRKRGFSCRAAAGWESATAVGDGSSPGGYVTCGPAWSTVRRVISSRHAFGCRRSGVDRVLTQGGIMTAAALYQPG